MYGEDGDGRLGAACGSTVVVEQVVYALVQVRCVRCRLPFWRLRTQVADCPACVEPALFVRGWNFVPLWEVAVV